jgi:hypothetical protein
MARIVGLGFGKDFWFYISNGAIFPNVAHKTCLADCAAMTARKLHFCFHPPLH